MASFLSSGSLLYLSLIDLGGKTQHLRNVFFLLLRDENLEALLKTAFDGGVRWPLNVPRLLLVDLKPHFVSRPVAPEVHSTFHLGTS